VTRCFIPSIHGCCCCCCCDSMRLLHIFPTLCHSIHSIHSSTSYLLAIPTILGEIHFNLDGWLPLHSIMIVSKPLSAAGLRAFPPEIREMIFYFSNALVWTGKTPALIVALRADQVLYGEVLELFCKWNTFKLHGPNQWKTGDMSLSAIETIRALEIEFW
jgi:hypothetical protein